MGKITENILEQIARMKESESAVQALYDRVSAHQRTENSGWEQINFSADELKLIKAALLHYQCKLGNMANDRKRNIECGSEDGNLDCQEEKQIVRCCLGLMEDLTQKFHEWYSWVHNDIELPEDERFNVSYSYFQIVKRLLLWTTHHSGGNSTSAKCRQLGLDPFEEIKFNFEGDGE